MPQIGDMQIEVVSDGIVHVDAGGPFGLVPRALYKHILDPDANNLIPMMLHCLLIRSGGKTILVDTGLGNNMDEKVRRNWGLVRPYGTLIDGLSRLGIKPADIDLVIDTHLHSDHCAGNVIISPEHGIAPTFPNAEYVVQRREYEDAMHPNERTRASYIPFHYQPLVESGQMRLLDGDTEILPGIWGMVTPGHTPAHMSIRFERNGEHGLYVADLASYACHFERLGWMTSYDVEPLITLETKRRWQQWALDTNAVLFFEHDPNIIAGRLVQHGDKLKVEPINVTIA